FEAHVALDPRQVARSFPIEDFRLLVEHAHDLVERRCRGQERVVELGELLHRIEEVLDVEHEREERSQRQCAAEVEVPAVAQHDGERDRREEVDEREVQAVQDDGLHVGLAVASGHREANMQTVVLNGLNFPFVDLLSSVALAVVLGYGGHLYFGGTLTLGTLFAFMLYVQNFFDPVQQLSQLYNTFLSATAALDKIMGVLDEQPEVLDREGARDLARIEGHVRFEGVRFTYGRGEEVLHGLDLDVPAGTTVALVGHTGAGKSTIAKLLARFYEPTHGRITIDELDLNEVTQASLRRQLGVVPQEGFLFAGPVAEHIA